eukprot:COSAG02_NODE_22_length_53020_cov_16.223125_19_plen_87_part_00
MPMAPMDGLSIFTAGLAGRVRRFSAHPSQNTAWSIMQRHKQTHCLVAMVSRSTFLATQTSVMGQSWQLVARPHVLQCAFAGYGTTA